MKASTLLNRISAVVVIVATLLLLLLVFFATNSAIQLWERLQTLPEWLFYSYVGVIGALLLASIWVIAKLLFGFRKKLGEDKPVDRESIIKEIEYVEQEGMETQDLRQELDELSARKDSGEIYVALFGDVSTGKSSIIKALLPDAEIDINIRGGSTQDVTRYTWSSRSEDKLILTDLPGRNEESGELDQMAADEAVRAQVVIYVTDSDLTRTMLSDVKTLQSFGKPLIIAINKSDRFNDEEQQLIRERIKSHFDKHTKLAFITSGGEEEILRIYSDGREEAVIRPRKADVEPLARLLQNEIDKQADVLENLRDASVFVLIKNKLDEKKVDFQREKAQDIVSEYTKKAILGAMASISPGADLVIQGVLGTLMVKKLCELYDTPVRQLDIDNFLNFSQGHMGKSIPLLMAVAGNGLKAFPGIGTVAGGLVHAVAYGLIFDALGRAVAKTLEERGALKAAPASLTFKEMLGDNLEKRAKLFARLVLDSRKEQ